MDLRWLQLFVLAFLTQKSATSSAFDRVLDDVQPCKDACDKTYIEQTPSNPKHSECCKRGCRFFSIVEFIHDHQNNMNATKDACMASCMEAYSQTGDRYACNIGCANQVPFAIERQKQLRSQPPSMHLLTPFMYVHNIYNNMVDHMSRIMSVSWSFYVQQDNGKMIVLQSEPEIVTEYLDLDEIDYEKNQEESNDSVDESFIDGDNAGEDRRRLQVEKSPSLDVSSVHSLSDSFPYGRSDDDGNSQGRVELVGSSATMYVTGGDDMNGGMDWLGCVARKSGLPRWLIGFTILSSALAMVWLCFSTTATAPDHYLRSQKLSLFGDLEYLKTSPQEKIRIQPEREDEAAPLPLKIHLQQV